MIKQERQFSIASGIVSGDGKIRNLIVRDYLGKVQIQDCEGFSSIYVALPSVSSLIEALMQFIPPEPPQ